MADNSPKDTSLQSTKQMLDELDALMERMLSLPVNDQEDAPAFSKESVKGPTLAASLTLLEPQTKPVTEPASPPPAPLSKSAASVPPSLPLSSKKPMERRARTTKFPQLPVKPPYLAKLPGKSSLTSVARDTATEAEKEVSLPFSAPEPKPLTNEVLPPTVLPHLDPRLTQTTEKPKTSRGFSVSFAPILWINHAFDQSTSYLGGAGRWLRGQFGRTLLGFSGIALFAMAVGWVLKDLLGWN